MKGLFKKLLACTMIGTMAFSFSGCGKSETQTASAGNTSAESTEGKESTDAAASAEGSKTVTLWTWDTATEEPVVKAFEAANPGYKVELVAIGYDDYMNKVQTSIASGTEIGDILLGEMGFRQRLFSMDILEDLSKEPYNFDSSQILDYVKPALTYDNKLVGLEGGINAGGLAYKAPLAKEYLGTDDPAELEKMMTSWEEVIKLGKQVQEKSGGSVYLFHSWADIQEVFDCFGDEPWTQDNKPTDYLLNKMPDERYKVLTEAMNAKVFDKSISDHYTPAMNSALAGDNHIFINAATWTSPFVIQPNDLEGKGRWRIMQAPGGAYNMGGAAFGIWKDSKNKEAAWKYIQWAFGTEEGCNANLEARGWTPPFKSFVETHDYSTAKDEWFAPQNIAEKFFKELGPKIKLRQPELYMNQIKAAFKIAESAILSEGADKISLERYKEIVVEDMKNNCPDLEF